MAEANTSRRSAARQASALPDDPFRAEPADRPQEAAAAAVVEDYNCPICLDLLLEPVVGACGHEFCKDCYTRWLARSRAYPTCPLCREVLSIVVPGISRRLAELIEATFPEKIQLRRQARELKAAAEAAAAPLPGQVNVESPEYDEPPEPTPTADSPLLPLSDLQSYSVMHLLQQQHNRRSDSPYPGREAYARVTRLHPSSLDSPYSSHSPTSSSDPSSAPSPLHSYGPEPDDGPSSPFGSYSPWSPTPGYTSSAPRPVYTPSSPVGSPGLVPTSPGFNPGSMYPSSADSPRYSDRFRASPSFPGSPPRRSTSPMTEIAERRRRRAHAGRTPPPRARHSPDAPDITANPDTAHDWPHLRPTSPQPRASSSQLRAASPQPHRDFSLLLQTTDQLAEQLQRASERLTYLTEYAGHSFARHGLAPPPPPMAPQPHMPYPPNPYAGHWEMPQAPLAAYSHYAAPAPYPSLPFNPMPWPGYGHYAAPRNSFAQSMPPTGRSFAQSMPPPGSLPFTMGSEPQAEAPRSSRQAQVAAAARTPARYRGRTPRTPPTRRRGGSSRSPRSPRSLAL